MYCARAPYLRSSLALYQAVECVQVTVPAVYSTLTTHLPILPRYHLEPWMLPCGEVVLESQSSEDAHTGNNRLCRKTSPLSSWSDGEGHDVSRLRTCLDAVRAGCQCHTALLPRARLRMVRSARPPHHVYALHVRMLVDTACRSQVYRCACAGAVGVVTSRA